jgi:hypothetical protein
MVIGCKDSDRPRHADNNIGRLTYPHASNEGWAVPGVAAFPLKRERSLEVVACGHRGETLRNSLPSTGASYPHSHHHLLKTTINGRPTSAIKRDAVDQYRGVVSRMDDVEQVESMAPRVALGY